MPLTVAPASGKLSSFFAHFPQAANLAGLLSANLRRRFVLAGSILAITSFAGVSGHAQDRREGESARPEVVQPRVVQRIDETKLATLVGHVNPAANAANDR